LTTFIDHRHSLKSPAPDSRPGSHTSNSGRAAGTDADYRSV